MSFRATVTLSGTAAVAIAGFEEQLRRCGGPDEPGVRECVLEIAESIRSVAALPAPVGGSGVVTAEVPKEEMVSLVGHLADAAGRLRAAGHWLEGFALEGLAGLLLELAIDEDRSFRRVRRRCGRTGPARSGRRG